MTPPFNSKSSLRRGLIPFALWAYALWAGLLRADDPAVVTPGEIASAAASVSADSSPSLHAGTLGLRDTGAGETTASLAVNSVSNNPPVSSAAVATSSPGAEAAASPNAMVNLVNLLVGQHVITKEAGDHLITQAQQEADTAQAKLATTQATAERALTVQSAAAVPPPSAGPATDDEERVPFVPDLVKNQIRDEVTEDVMKKSREDNVIGKTDDNVPDWVKHFRVSGDIRTRYEGDFYSGVNAFGNFTNYNAINTGSGINVNPSAPTTPLPEYNVDQNRNRFRLRARVGAEVDLAHGFTVGLRLGTGADDSPVTENQTLGAVNNGQGGNFSKYAIWLDRGFIKYEMGNGTDQSLAFTVGRFDNPFFHTSMIWSDDLGFDGALVQAKYKVADGVTPFFVAGGFPVFNTDLNFSSTQSPKFDSEDKYLLATQVGTNWTINKDFSAKVAAAYYYFDNVQGKVSDPIDLASNNEAGNTDDSRPFFAQNGNTYIALRDYEDPNPGVTPEIQYYGLATPFHEFALTSQLDYSGLDPFHVWLTGEFVKNLAFDRNAIINNGPATLPGPQNNLATPGDIQSFAGGDTGWNVRLNLGKVALQNLWDWNVNLGYRYVESDATVDGFTDSDFGASLAGTNLKGFTVGGNLALSPQVWLSLRWMSANAIAGPTYRSDLIQFDINAKF